MLSETDPLSISLASQVCHAFVQTPACNRSSCPPSAQRAPFRELSGNTANPGEAQPQLRSAQAATQDRNGRLNSERFAVDGKYNLPQAEEGRVAQGPSLSRRPCPRAQVPRTRINSRYRLRIGPVLYGLLDSVSRCRRSTQKLKRSEAAGLGLGGLVPRCLASPWVTLACGLLSILLATQRT